MNKKSDVQFLIFIYVAILFGALIAIGVIVSLVIHFIMTMPLEVWMSLLVFDLIIAGAAWCIFRKTQKRGKL